MGLGGAQSLEEQSGSPKGPPGQGRGSEDWEHGSMEEGGTGRGFRGQEKSVSHGGSESKPRGLVSGGPNLKLGEAWPLGLWAHARSLDPVLKVLGMHGILSEGLTGSDSFC